jgi:D-alanine transaminase
LSVVYLNGEYLREEQAQVSVHDRGFLFGDGIYEMIPVYAGRPFRVVEHLQRLANSLEEVGISNPCDQEKWLDIFATLLERNGDGDQKIYLQVTRGAPPAREHKFPVGVKPTVMVSSKTLYAPADKLQDRAASAIVCEDIRWHRCDIKTISLLPNVLMSQQAINAGAEEAILVRDGLVTEGASSNVFVVLEGEVYTAPKGPRILGGITRDLIIELINADGISFMEQSVTIEQLRNASEIWVSSSTREIMPVVKLDGKPVGNGQVGPVTETVAALYKKFKEDFLAN